MMKSFRGVVAAVAVAVTGGSGVSPLLFASDKTPLPPVTAELKLSAAKVCVSQEIGAEIEVSVPALTGELAEVNPVHSPAGEMDMMMPMFPGERGNQLHVECGYFAEGALGPAAKAGSLDSILQGDKRQAWTLDNVTVQSIGFPRPAMFPLESRREGDRWVYTMKLPPFTAAAEGEIVFRPATITIPVITGVDRFRRATIDFKKVRTAERRVVSMPAPAEGRPAGYCGVIARDLTCELSLIRGQDARAPTQGDVLTLELTAESSGDLSRMTPPAMPKSAAIKISGAAKEVADIAGKMPALPGGAAAHERKWRWRARPVEAGTTEIPPIAIFYFDPVKEAYVDASTKPMPLQILPAAQAVLGDIDDDESWPMPDGLIEGADGEGLRRENPTRQTWLWLAGGWCAALAALCAARRVRPTAIASLACSVAAAIVLQLALAVGKQDAPQSNAIDGNRMQSNAGAFTWQRAMSLAKGAATEGEFKKAAEAFEDCIRAGADNPTIWKNIGGVRYFAADYTGSRDAYLKAERFNGADETTRRGLVAANARLKADPSAELPLDRQLLRPWCALGLDGKVTVCVVAWCLAWIVALVRSALRRPVGLCVLCVLAMQASADGAVSVKARFVPDEAVVDEEVALVLDCTMPKDVEIEDWHISGLPEKSVWGRMEEMAGGEATPSNVTKRVRVRGRVTEPGGGNLNLAVRGMLTRRTVQGNFSMVNKSSFGVGASARLKVDRLPEDGRPEDFSGAVGEVSLRQTLSRENASPGDLVEATYLLEWRGFMPTNAVPRMTDASQGLKAYGLKEVSREDDKAVWRETYLVQTTNDVQTAGAELSYFDTAARKYAVAVAQPAAIAVSPAAAKNDAPGTVAVGGRAAEDVGEVAKVRFGPSERSPVLFTVPRTAVPENGGKWVRIETTRGAGWTKGM